MLVPTWGSDQKINLGAGVEQTLDQLLVNVLPLDLFPFHQSYGFPNGMGHLVSGSVAETHVERGPGVVLCNAVNLGNQLLHILWEQRQISYKNLFRNECFRKCCYKGNQKDLVDIRQNLIGDTVWCLYYTFWWK